MGAIDLHCHSTASDGTLAPGDVVARAAANGVKVLALTDHDDCSGLDAAYRAADACGVTLIPGVEISVSWRRWTVHVVGLRVDPASARLGAGLADLRTGRMARAEAMAADLDRIGFRGSLDGARRWCASGTMIGRTHFARFLVEQGAARDVRGVFRHYLVPGRPGYVEHAWASLADAVGWVCASGGVAVLAHPGRYKLSRRVLGELVGEFRAAGGKAIEVVSGAHTPEQARAFARHAIDGGLLASVGTDFHGPEESHLDLGRLPALEPACRPVWHEWPEARMLCAA